MNIDTAREQDDARQIDSLFDAAISADDKPYGESVLSRGTLPPFEVWLELSEDEKELYSNGSTKWVEQ